MSLRKWIPETAWSRPVTVFTLLATMIVLGALAWARIPLLMMPAGFQSSWMNIYIPVRDMSPEETDERVIGPILDEFSTLSGLKRSSSEASADRASITLEFHGSVPATTAYNDVVDRLERAMVELPSDVDRYWLWKYNPDQMPIIWAGVELSEDVDDETYIMEQVVKPAIMRVSGVASIDTWGVTERRVYIDFDREKLFAHAIDLGDLQGRLGSDNFQMTGGSLEGDGVVTHVRSLARYDDLTELKAFPVKDNLRLDDIATIRLTTVGSASIHRVNGNESAGMSVQKESGANAVDVSTAVVKALDELEKDPRMRGSKVFAFFNQGDMIEASNDTLMDTAITGGLLSLVILFVFLREWRMTALIALSIPFSMTMTIACLYFTGETMNLIAMMGLMLAVGMVVDNAVVVVESIYTHRGDGDDPKTAAIEGTSEVNMAILASTATTMVVFLPVMLMTDDATMGYFLGVLGMPVIYALGASLVAAMVFAPLATRYIGTAQVKEDARWLKWLAAKYEQLLGWVLNRRWDASLALLAGLIVTMTVAIPGVPFNAGADENMNDFSIRFSVPPQATYYDRVDIVDRFEELVEENKEAWGVRVYRSRLRDRASRGSLNIYLVDEGPMTRAEVIEDARKKLPRDLAGTIGSIGWGGDQGGGKNTLSLNLYGEDIRVLRGLADEVIRRAVSAPSVMNGSFGADEAALDELQLRVDRQAVRRAGVSSQQVGQTVAFAMRGNQLPDLVDGDREITVLTQLELADRSDIQTVMDFPIWSPVTQSMTPVRALTNLEVAKGPDEISREGRRTSLELSFNLEDDVARDQAMGEISATLGDMAMPRGYSWSPGRYQDEAQAENTAMFAALGMSVCFVFLLMGILFESWMMPMAILTTIPMAMMGAFWGLYLTGTSMDTMAGIGLVVLVGVVVNNGIVLVDLIVALQRKGLSQTEAIMQAGRRRLRPILMTAATTIFGLVPMAMGSSDTIGIPYSPLGRTVIGGLTTATILTLVFVPFLYAVFDDTRQLATTWLRRISGRNT